MKRVAFLSYFFPPVGGGGTSRSAKFVKYLYRFGFRPTVFTVRPESHEQSREFRLDDSQVVDLASSEYDHVQIANPSGAGYRHWIRQSRLFPLAWTAGYPWLYESSRPWAFAAARAIIKAHRKHPFDLIYVSAGPNSALEAAAWASRRLSIPWIADLRDLWTRDTLKFFPSRGHYLWESWLERRILGTASAVVANTSLSGDRLRESLGPGASDRVTVIPNGFDAEDFPAETAWSAPRKGAIISVLHAGTLYPPKSEMSRLGRYRPVGLNHTARSVQPIVAGLLALREERPDLADRYRVRLLGHLPAESHQTIASSGLGDQFSCEGNLPRDEALKALKRTDALLVVQVAFTDARKPVPYVPGKIYEYLATGAPIVAPVPPGDLRDLLDMAPQAYVSDYQQPREISASLRRLASDLDSHTIDRCDPHWLVQYSRLELTARLAAVFGDVLHADSTSRSRSHAREESKPSNVPVTTSTPSWRSDAR